MPAMGRVNQTPRRATPVELGDGVGGAASQDLETSKEQEPEAEEVAEQQCVEEWQMSEAHESGHCGGEE